MKTYLVTIYYHTYIDVEVKANSEEEAIANAYVYAGKKEYDSQFLNNAQSDNSPDVEEIYE